MSDRTSSRIRIGGVLDLALVPELVAAAKWDHGSRGWDEPGIEEADVVSGEPLEVFAFSLTNGRFEHLERFCIDHGLTFRVDADGCFGTFGPERVLYDARGAPRTFQQDEQGHVVATLANIRQLGSVAAIEDWFAAADAPTPQLVLVTEQVSGTPSKSMITL